MAAPETLRGRSLPELRERLRRQERLLGDRKFISRLPDKGKKISDCVEKLKMAILQEEELNRTTELLSAVRLEFQKKREEAESSQRRIAVSGNPAMPEDSPPELVVNEELESALQNNPRVQTKKRNTQGVLEAAAACLPQSDREAPEPSSLGKTDVAARPASGSHEVLVEAFERISIEEEMRGGKSEKGQHVKDDLSQSLPNRTPKTPHYIEVLEQRAKNPVATKSKFKANLLPAESRRSSPGSPGIPSHGGPSVSAEERRRRDKKHLNDITAARLPPLHHMPTQMLSIGKSIAIQIQQKEAYEALQGKLAAQKLAKRLDIKMACYEPEGEMVTNYREVRDEDGYSSAED